MYLQSLDPATAVLVADSVEPCIVPIPTLLVTSPGLTVIHVSFLCGQQSSTSCSFPIPQQDLSCPNTTAMTVLLGAYLQGTDPSIFYDLVSSPTDSSMLLLEKGWVKFC